MKKIHFLLSFFAIFLMSCQKNVLEIEISNPNKGLQGSWRGVLNCSACCNPQYQLNLEIHESTDNQSFTTSLTITSVKNNQVQGYAVYQVPASFEGGILKLNGGNIIKTERFDGGSCRFCEQNFFTLRQISPTRFEGTWDSSSSCDRTFQANASVIIEKI